MTGSRAKVLQAYGSMWGVIVLSMRPVRLSRSLSHLLSSFFTYIYIYKLLQRAWKYPIREKPLEAVIFEGVSALP